MSERIIGIVKWFNGTKGFGFLEREGGPDVFVTSATIRGGFKNLSEGEKVEFSIEKGPKGLQATDVIPLEREIIPSKATDATPLERKITPSSERIIGIVKWFNGTKGFGFLEREGGPDVFVTLAAIRGGFKNLSEGEKVEFSIEKGPKGLQATDVIPLEREITPSKATDITPLERKITPSNIVKPSTPILSKESPSLFQNFLDRVRTPINQPNHGLSIFLCHSSNDKPLVRKLYQRLKADNFDPWLDEEKLIPGQEWRLEISKAVRNADIVIVCLSRSSITKAGYVQKEITYALDISDEQPEGTIFLIPLKLEECEVPERLSRWHWVNYFETSGYQKLLSALHLRAEKR